MTANHSTPTQFERWDVVVVPFPFTDRASAKRRPALVLSDAPFNSSGHSILAMITTAARTSWTSDTRIKDLNVAGLQAPSVVRCNLFTLDNRLLQYTAGRLTERDIAAVKKRLRHILP